MTHTLHRLGSPENLKDDFVVFAMSAKGINEKGSAKNLRRFLAIAHEFSPINAGDMKTGNILTHSIEDILDNIQDVSIVHAVFTKEETVAALLKRLEAEDLGISVVISGLINRVEEIGNQTQIKQHTVECSGGIWGRTDKLPDAATLQITTMCGHGMVAASLVEHYARLIRRDKISADEAARELAKPCVCGVFNQARAARLIMAVVNQEENKERIQAGQTSVP
jgi:hypothetical protein